MVTPRFQRSSLAQFGGRRAMLYLTIILSAFLLSRMGTEKALLLPSDSKMTLLAETLRKQNHSEPLLAIDTKRTQLYAYKNKGKYRLQGKIAAVERLFGFVKNLDLDQEESVVLIGGVHDGTFSASILQKCPSITLYGFDILKGHYEAAAETLKSYPHATVLNVGWDEIAAKNVHIGGQGRSSGLYDPKGQHGWDLQDETAKTVAIADWAEKNGVSQTLFVVVETEGREPKVIRGMRLDQEENRKRFPLIQYELGATWAEEDNRHGDDPWDQEATAQFLIDMGYHLFLVGLKDWLAVDAGFFSRQDSNPTLTISNEFGSYINGNLMAMHSVYTPADLATVILQQSHVEKPQ